MDDKKLIELFEARSPDAIEQTDTQYGALCRSLAGKLLRNESEVEECVNDAYLALWNAIPPAKPSPLSSYLAKIVRNLAMKRLEHRTAQKRNCEATLSFDELDTCIPASEGGEQMLESFVLRQAITAFLQSLSQQNRIIFLRRYFFFDSVQEIAQRYRISESKVKSSLMRTRNKLRTYLIQEGLFL